MQKRQKAPHRASEIGTRSGPARTLPFEPLLRTKLYAPPLRPKTVTRGRLLLRLTEGPPRTLTLVSAPPGYGKSTLVSQWLTEIKQPFAWLSLDQGDNDPTHFLTYFVAALQTIVPNIGTGVLHALQSPQLPAIEPILTALLNEITTIPDEFILVLDDYHVVDSKLVDQTLSFLLEHLPPQMHLVIAAREDPQLPLARLRTRNQLTELRAADLRFTPSEATEFLNRAMGLNLSERDIAALETRTEGWIAGLQLAALSMHGQPEAASFVRSFTGSHRFVLDYLVEEVLHRQPVTIQAFLLRTSILDCLCGSLCDAVLRGDADGHPFPSGQETLDIPGQETLERLEHANLFLVPLDNERRWYRYHHLFGDLLRQRLQQSVDSSAGEGRKKIAELHRRASVWYEENGLELEAFRHAVSAGDIDRAARLAEGKGMPLHFRHAAAPVLSWLESLPATELDARPALWVMYASALLFVGKHTAVEPNLQAAEAALRGIQPDEANRNLVGRIASMRATLAVIQRDAETILAQSYRALEYLHPSDLPVRAATTWTMGYAYQLQGNRTAASRAYARVISDGESFGDSIYTLAATLSLGQVQETNNQLSLAAETYRRTLLLAGDPPQSMACEAHLGLARIFYQWNDLQAAEQHGQQCIELARQIESIDTVASYAVFLAHLGLARGDVGSAVTALDEATEYVRRHNFVHVMPMVAAAQVQVLLHQGNLTTAAELTRMHPLPISQARVHLAEGDPSTALAVLEPVLREASVKGWADERLKAMVLQALALHAHSEKDRAVQVLEDALALAKPEKFTRIFVDEGAPMAQLLYDALALDIEPAYIRRLLAAYPAAEPTPVTSAEKMDPELGIVEALSERERQVLELIAEGLTNQEVATRLYLSLHTVKVHARNIFSKLGVKNRTQAVTKGRALGILSQAPSRGRLH